MMTPPEITGPWFHFNSSVCHFVWKIPTHDAGHQPRAKERKRERDIEIKAIAAHRLHNIFTIICSSHPPSVSRITPSNHLDYSNSMVLFNMLSM